MNSRLRHWREAATVLLAAGGVGPACGGASARLPGALASSSSSPPPSFDYELLLLRRSAGSGFMPGAYVFPGGTVDAADFSAEWLQLLPEPPPRCGLGPVKGPRAPLFATERSELGGSPLPGDVAFRICAIRETFEEAGVLLLAPAAEGGRPGPACDGSPARLLPAERLPPASELAEWRRRVQRQPGAFLQLCRHLRCVPNIWALHEWSNWLTPAGRGGRRFDTAFYLCCLGQSPPPASHDQAEVTACKWTKPSEAIELFKSQDIWIPPPQFYELCRLCNFPSLRDLHRFGFERAVEGCERWMPVLLIASDGFMQILPGDELYPEDPDFTGERKLTLSTNKKTEDVLKEAIRLHRVVIQDLNKIAIHVNIPSKYKHINPLPLDSKMGNSTDCSSKL
ncbi:acyl-coenzyme A diphosphatase NUDT19 [Sphaerodactylus townsendi]|uniref:Nucleoside diphosphate-linked moiety X motif 19, mitochondrial n=1 Tax=Sphaerodactylus townsendi TaxID=933632 RepID=A0ACB8EAF7_9SAUR|nr:acyl-coenzyme A diphosphatase NUDT19 [Sphaerodactylus townsendi]